MDQLVVSELFGPTFQGEGPSSGRVAGFVRLGRCNLSCTFCDTPYTWDWSTHDPAVELSRLAVGEVLARLDAMDVDLVVVTGGEPLLQARPLAALLQGIRARGWEVEVETNGTLPPLEPGGLVDRYNVSPKLANSGIERERRYHPDVLRAFEATGRAVFKFVVGDARELDEVAEMVSDCGLDQVFVMPEGTDPAEVTAKLRQLAGPVLARRWNLTNRFHILLWGDRRGV